MLWFVLFTQSTPCSVGVFASFAATEHNRNLGDLYLVFDYMEYDLGGLLNSNVEFLLPEIKCLAKQLFTGALSSRLPQTAVVLCLFFSCVVYVCYGSTALSACLADGLPTHGTTHTHTHNTHTQSHTFLFDTHAGNWGFVAAGLHYLKTKGVLHRDLKVANVLLNRKGILKIADFGGFRVP